MDKKIVTLKEETTQELSNILNFWAKNTIDETNGGFIGAIDGDGTKHPEAEKGAVLNARILWSYSAAYRITKNEEYLKLAKRALEYNIKHFFDRKNGGSYWMLTPEGKPSNTRKQIYAIAFLIYGISEYVRATGDEKPLSYAQDLFIAIERYSFDKQNNGYIEALSEDWQTLEDMRLSDKDANSPKSMNTHLHILEAYACLYRVWKDVELEQQLKNLIEVFLDKIIDQQHGFFNLFFSMDWKHESQINSYGHDIEGSWLLWEAAEVLGDQQVLQRVKPVILKMAEQALRDGIDHEDGGMMNDGLFGKIEDSDKHWWPQAESVIGFFNAWQLSNDEKFLQASINSWNFIKSYIIDHQKGEWFWRVSRTHQVYTQEQKTGPWKCPYHNSRMCMEIIERINSL